MAIQEVRVAVKPYLPDLKGEEILFEIRNSLKINSVESVRTAKVFRLEGIGEDEADYLAQNLLCESVFQIYEVNRPILDKANKLVEVAYKPGVMNPEAGSVMKSARDLGVSGLVAVDSSWEYAFFGSNISGDEMNMIFQRLLVNDTIEHIVKIKPKTLIIKGETGRTDLLPIRKMNDKELMELSKDKLFLNLEEMQAIKEFFLKIGRDPTDCEIETIAQTWSEHCVHKTFKSTLLIDGREKMPLLQRLQHATEKTGHPLVRSAFVDNSGVFEFYDGMAICGKVETHNSPSAIEPYGGAMTGSGGVFRDIIGTGQGAKVIASTDMFCFAPPDITFEDVPPGCLHPHYLLRRVVAGVRDYGNRMGIPTNNGSLHFHQDFRAKPTIIVGAYGIMPVDRCQKGAPKVGDLVVCVGGRTGRDGIHGATFSSGAMTDRTISVNSSAVQIGHPIEEKRMSDAILRARDEDLIRAITDCGAGGFASAVGEMGKETGAKIALDKAPLKYTGLHPWEILLSESQERMIVAVAPKNVDSFLEICREFNVEATILGKFTGEHRFVATYGGEIVMDLEMEFLHHGLPKRVLKGSRRKINYEEPPDIENNTPAEWKKICKRVMGHLNVCSKEPIVRFYDHGVQGTNVLQPYAGVELDAPNDAVVLTPILGKPYGIVISHGLNPVLNKIDSYYGSLWAAAEAVSNAVATGANPQEIALIDNFIWPFPTEELLSDLDKAVDACVDFVKATGMPFISGKDSLSSTYKGEDGTVVEIPPVLCVSAFGRIKDVKNTVSTDFKRPGSQIILIGSRNTGEMGGSVYYDLLGFIGNKLPRIDLNILPRVLNALHRAISSGIVLACHDISEGGLFAAAAEMCFGSNLGAEIYIPEKEKAEFFLFNETTGCFLAEIDEKIDAGEIFNGIPFRIIGRTINSQQIKVSKEGEKSRELFVVELPELKRAWQLPMKEVFY